MEPLATTLRRLASMLDADFDYAAPIVYRDLARILYTELVTQSLRSHDEQMTIPSTSVISADRPDTPEKELAASYNQLFAAMSEIADMLAVPKTAINLSSEIPKAVKKLIDGKAYDETRLPGW